MNRADLTQVRETGANTTPAGTMRHSRPEAARVAARFWICLILSVLVAALVMVVPRLGGHVYSPTMQSWGAIAQLALATPVVLWGCWPHLVRGWADAKSGNPGRYTLIGMTAGIAYAYSAVAVLWPELFPDAFRGTHGLVRPHFITATAIVTLALLVELLAARRRWRRGA